MAVKKIHFEIDDIVYRAKWEKIEEGKVVSISPCSIANSGSPYYDSKGEYTLYVAKFGDYQYEEQTYPWKFFKDKKSAYQRLAWELESRIDEHTKQITKWHYMLKSAIEKSK